MLVAGSRLIWEQTSRTMVSVVRFQVRKLVLTLALSALWSDPILEYVLYISMSLAELDIFVNQNVDNLSLLPCQGRAKVYLFSFDTWY